MIPSRRQLVAVAEVQRPRLQRHPLCQYRVQCVARSPWNIGACVTPRRVRNDTQNCPHPPTKQERKQNTVTVIWHGRRNVTGPGKEGSGTSYQRPVPTSSTNLEEQIADCILPCPPGRLRRTEAAPASDARVLPFCLGRDPVKA